jgi:hypothetical protein
MEHLIDEPGLQELPQHLSDGPSLLVESSQTLRDRPGVGQDIK